MVSRNTAFESQTRIRTLRFRVLKILTWKMKKKGTKKLNKKDELKFLGM